jgi:Bacterial Ig-like domain (group 1)
MSIGTSNCKNAMHRVIIISAICLATGCVPYPIYKTLQPAATVTVRDAASNPLAGVSVTLTADARPSWREKSHETVKTNAQGIATFESKKEWRTEVFFIHGAEQFFWSWCVERPGYATYISYNEPIETFSDELTIVLSPGESKPCTTFDMITADEITNDLSKIPASHFGPTIETRKACAAVDGDWVKVGFALKESCVVPTRDGGKRCRDTQNCNGMCVAPADSSPGMRIDGACANTYQLQCANYVMDGIVRPDIC